MLDAKDRRLLSAIESKYPWVDEDRCHHIWKSIKDDKIEYKSKHALIREEQVLF